MAAQTKLKRVLNADGSPKRPSAEPRNTPAQPANTNTRAAMPPGFGADNPRPGHLQGEG